MTVHAEGLMRKEKLLDDLTADEQLKWKCREHIQPEAEPRDVDESVGLTQCDKIELSSTSKVGS